MPATLTTVNAITKEVYGPRVVDQLENELTLTKRIEKTSQGTSSDVGGKYVTFPLKVRRNTGISYRNEMAALGPAGQQGWNSVRVPLRYGYGRVQMSGQTMELVNTNYNAFATAMTEEMDGLKTDLAKDTNRVLWGNGLGVLATIGSATGPLATVTVATGFDGVKYLDLDMLVDVTDAAGVPVANGTARTISGINETTGVITFSGAANLTVVVGGLIVRSGNYGLEPNGLTSLVSNSTASLFNLSSTTEPLWSSTVDSSGGALSESKMIAMCDGLRQKGGKPSAIFTDLGSRRAYFNLLTTQRRFTDTKSFDGGLRGLTFAYDDEIPVVTDVDAPAGKMWFLKEDTFKIYRSKPWYWEDRDGGIWKWVVGYDAFEALMKQYWEFAIDRRNVNGVMTSITPG